MPSLEPATPDFLDTAPFRVVTEATVLAPIDRCWELIADQSAWERWFDGLKLLAASPNVWTAPGDTRRVKVNGLKVDERCISMEAEREYAFTIVKWPLPTASKAAEALRLEDRTNGGSPRTTITYIGAFEPTFLGRFSNKILEKALVDGWGKAMKKLGTLARA